MVISYEQAMLNLALPCVSFLCPQKIRRLYKQGSFPIALCYYLCLGNDSLFWFQAPVIYCTIKYQYIFFISVINQLDAQNFCLTLRLFHSSICFEHECSSSGGQNCITQSLVSSHQWVAVSCTPMGVMIPEAV